MSLDNSKLINRNIDLQIAKRCCITKSRKRKTRTAWASPYSKQIHVAFDQVTPLLAAGFRVLETTCDVSVLVALIQVLTALLLGVIALCLLGLLVTTNPDLEAGRRAVVTPTVRWPAAWVFGHQDRQWLGALACTALAGVALSTCAGVQATADVAPTASGDNVLKQEEPTDGSEAK